MSVSPFRGALSVFGLTGDDITLVSCHGTSTKKNDLNEPSILEQQMDALQRTPGNPLYVVTQKWLTGHPKGPAAAWQINGVMQAMQDNVIPGNRNLDSVDPDLRKFKSLFFTNKTMRNKHISAALINSFGFGQAGGQCLVIHPEYFLASITDSCYDEYLARLEERNLRIFKHRQDILGNRSPFVPIKDPNSTPHAVPFSQAALDKSIRREKTLLVRQAALAAPSFQPQSRVTKDVEATAILEQVLVQATAASSGSNLGIGVDAEPIRQFESSFLERNFSKIERDDIVSHDESTGTQRTTAGHWAVKESVAKALGNAGADLASAQHPLADIELCRDANGSLKVQFHGRAQAEAAKVGAREVHVSLSYAQGVAYAVAILH